MPESIDGIPLHPLFVHAPGVLIPIASLIAILWALVPKWRGALQWWMLAFVGAAWLGTVLAGSTGESLAESIQETGLVEEHEELAEGLETFVWVLALSVAAAFSIDRWGERLGGARRGLAILSVVAVVVGSIGATTMDVLAGHSGAKAAWDDYEAR